MEKKREASAPLPKATRYGWSPGTMPERMLGKANGSGAGGGLPLPVPPGPIGIEGTMLYQKSIDNSTVHYKHDPSDRDALRRYVSLALFVVLMVCAFSAPRIWVRHSGYRQAELNQKIEQLAVVRDRLKVTKGRLEDLRRVAVFAELIGLQETEESNYTWFAPSETGAAGRPEVAQLLVSEE